MRRGFFALAVVVLAGGYGRDRGRRIRASSAARAAQGRFASPSCLSALEVGRPLLQERGHALAEVLGLCRDRLELSLPLELLLQRRRLRVVEEALRERDPARRQRRELGRESRRAGGQRIGLDDLRDKAPPVRLGRRQAPAGGEPLERARVAEQPRREERRTRVRDEADVDEGRDEG